MIICSNYVKSILADLNAQTWAALQEMTVLKDLGSAVIVSFCQKFSVLKRLNNFSRPIFVNLYINYKL